jgi:hypothetical protein
MQTLIIIRYTQMPISIEEIGREIERKIRGKIEEEILGSKA